MLTPDAKKLLAETIRGTQQDPGKGLRDRLLHAIHDEADRRYRFSLTVGEAGLDETQRKQRSRIEAWLDERARATQPKGRTELRAARDRFLAQAEKEAAATFVNRIVLLRHLEALGLSRPAVVTGGWNSKGYREFREFAPTLCSNGTTDATEGYATLLQLVFDELAVDLPGLFGDVGLTRLFPIPAATLRDVVERFDDPELASAWTDDTTLGWVYQYWNDPDREKLDLKISTQGGGGKIEPHEIASKTQMFTERYMVEWLLQNSLGLTWLAMCRKRGWAADAERVLPLLDVRRAEWRAKRDAGDVALDALMPTEGELEEHWKYYVPQPIPDDAVAKAPDSVRVIKILDPACGSGHFLVIAFGLLIALYREEARHLGTTVSDRAIAESIVEHNLYGIDIDPRAIQIAAAGLYLKAKSLSKTAQPKSVNLVAPVLQLGSLPSDDPAVSLLRRDLKREVGIPEELTTKLLSALAGVDYLGSLLKVDSAVEGALKNVELEFERSRGQGDIFRGFPAQQVKLSVGEAKATILDKLEQFLAKHSRSEDLGLRLDGEQLAAGVRFVRMAREGAYDLVVGNPPYQSLSKTNLSGYVAAEYSRGKADLYAAFLERGLELVKPGGMSCMVTMQGWMFLTQFAELRGWLTRDNDLRSLADLMWKAFEIMRHATIAMTVIRRAPPSVTSVAIMPTPREERDESFPAFLRKRAAVLAQIGRYQFDASGFAVIQGQPLVYWWTRELLTTYGRSVKLADVAEVRVGVRTSNNARFIRRPWELLASAVYAVRVDGPPPGPTVRHVPLVMGGAGRAWAEPLTFVILWADRGLEVCVTLERAYGAYPQSTEFYFRAAVSLPKIGTRLKGRIVRFRSIIDNAAPSVFSDSTVAALCTVNRSDASRILGSFNPTVNLQPGDILRLPVHDDPESGALAERVLASFQQEEEAREPSVEFRRPGPSAWAYAQTWAQVAVDRPDDTPLPPYEPVHEPPVPGSFVSFNVGIALGRFGANGEGILNASPPSALPYGILFVCAERGDSLDHLACTGLHDAWTDHGSAVSPGDDLGTYLRKSFFDQHKKLYENRPIYFPFSSAKRSFVAFVSIHRWQDDTLRILLADYLVPTRRRLEGELEDLRTARATGNNKGKAERRFTDVQKLLEELTEFIARVTDVADVGPPPPDEKTTAREADATYVMDLDDGVMVNSAALWPLLEAQWKDPKRWWKELANAKGKKDCDWSHLAARYFPTRVDKKCHDDPSLAVAHACFWELHPAKAYAWELRLQDEIRPDFTIDEPASHAARAAFLKQHEREAQDVLAKELKRRERKDAKADDAQSEIEFDAGDADEAADD